jgi:DNA-binding NarL/FixJ family response regulator
MSDLAGRRKSILIVDDSPDIRSRLRGVLGGQPDWEICGEAENGRVAVDMAKELCPDIIILDLSMPVMNGLDAAREIRKFLPAAHIFLFSAYHTDNLEETARDAGIDAYIPKSEIHTLLARVGQFAAS